MERMPIVQLLITRAEFNIGTYEE